MVLMESLLVLVIILFSPFSLLFQQRIDKFIPFPSHIPFIARKSRPRQYSRNANHDQHNDNHRKAWAGANSGIGV